MEHGNTVAATLKARMGEAIGPVNRGVEMSGALLDDPRCCLVEEQVTNGIAVRMALLYLLAAA